MCQEANHFSHGKATYMTGLLIGSLFGGAVSDRLVFPPFLSETFATEAELITELVFSPSNQGMERNYYSFAAQRSMQSPL